MLVNYGFRLPSALDNRPLNFDEFMDMTRQVVYVGATPANLSFGTVLSAIEALFRSR